MSCFSVFRAITVRLLFSSHGAISIWRLYVVTKDQRFWYLACALGLLLLEMTVTLGKKGGKEWKWFCPSVLIYLMCVVPAIWFLELNEMERRIQFLAANNGSILPQNESMEEMSATLGSAFGFRFEIRIPILMTSDEWIRTLEQLLLLILILGRWILPKGKLTHDQLSQLLLVYIGTAADIVEFFDAFKEEVVRYNKLLCMIILGIWTLSLLQFTLVLTASRVRRDQSGLATEKPPVKKVGCCSADVYGIVISILLQDVPFLVLRMLLIFRYGVLSYTNMFFTSKNTIVIILLIYRLVVVQVEKSERGRVKKLKQHRYPYDFQSKRLADSMSLTDSISTSCSSYYDSKSRLVGSASIHSNGWLDTPRSQRRRKEKQRLARTYTLEDLNTDL
ncbi:transmembrane protein 26-like [Haliotis rufescens]|uniref:transmembrane protein 26-like n=1 Tax=Haliotis rufescens TaxID=6454 RepID=UPI001EB07F9E|nr:transmembrane protein 26-like [Haliotis rufescens]XP_046375849.1 transmembrane protein 26-like [Haliotis rufescens]